MLLEIIGAYSFQIISLLRQYECAQTAVSTFYWNWVTLGRHWSDKLLCLIILDQWFPSYLVSENMCLSNINAIMQELPMNKFTALSVSSCMSGKFLDILCLFALQKTARYQVKSSQNIFIKEIHNTLERLKPSRAYLSLQSRNSIRYIYI